MYVPNKIINFLVNINLSTENFLFIYLKEIIKDIISNAVEKRVICVPLLTVFNP